MKKRTKLKRNLAICIMIALLGIAITIISNILFDFNISGNWPIANSNNNTIICFSVICILIFEWALSMFGIFLTILGGIGIYNNAKKMR